MNISLELERETSQTTERLSALHNKLHQEAEKIRKWKTKTDLELNDKVAFQSFLGETISNSSFSYNIVKGFNWESTNLLFSDKKASRC